MRIVYRFASASRNMQVRILHASLGVKFALELDSRYSWDMKKCSKCGEEKSLSEFYWRNKAKGTRMSACKACRSTAAAQRWASGSEKESNYESKARRVQRAYDYIWSVLSTSSCADCDERNPLVFEFDHVRGTKIRDVGTMVVQNYGLQAIKDEIAKCEVVCANCHKIRTSTRANTWRVQRLASST